MTTPRDPELQQAINWCNGILNMLAHNNPKMQLRIQRIKWNWTPYWHTHQHTRPAKRIKR